MIVVTKRNEKIACTRVRRRRCSKRDRPPPARGLGSGCIASHRTEPRSPASRHRPSPGRWPRCRSPVREKRERQSAGTACRLARRTTARSRSGWCLRRERRSWCLRRGSRHWRQARHAWSRPWSRQRQICRHYSWHYAGFSETAPERGSLPPDTRSGNCSAQFSSSMAACPPSRKPCIIGLSWGSDCATNTAA